MSRYGRWNARARASARRCSSGGRRSEALRASIGLLDARFRAPGHRAARSARAARRGTRRRSRRVARRPVAHRPVAVPRVVHVERRIRSRADRPRRRPTDRAGRAGTRPRRGARRAARACRPAAARCDRAARGRRTARTTVLALGGARPAADRTRRGEPPPEFAEQHDLPEALRAEPRDRPGDVDAAAARGARPRRGSGTASSSP